MSAFLLQRYECEAETLPIRERAMKPAAMILAAMFWLTVSAVLADGKVHRIKPTSDLNKILKQVRAGDTILLQNGTW